MSRLETLRQTGGGGSVPGKTVGAGSAPATGPAGALTSETANSFGIPQSGGGGQVPAQMTDENPYDDQTSQSIQEPGQYGIQQTGTGPQEVTAGVGFRDRAEASNPFSVDAQVPGLAPAIPEELADEDPYGFAPTQSGDGGPAQQINTHRDAQGNIYRPGSASDPYADRRGGGLPFGLELPGADSLPFPGVTGAILGGVGGLSNRNLDRIQQGATDGTEGYSYGEFGNQRFGTSPGFLSGSTVTSGPTALRGLAVNQTVPNTPANQARLLEAAEQDTYQSASGNTYAGAVATAKRRSDEEAQSRGYGSAVTDQHGNAVRSTTIDPATGKGTIVTSGGRIQQEEESVQYGNDDSDSGGGGK